MFKKLTWNLIKHNDSYFSVHIQDIISFNTDTADELETNEAVTFLHDNIILTGTITSSSDDKGIILNEQNKLSVNFTEYNWFIVKYKTTTKNLLFTLIAKNDVNWLNSKDKDLILINGKKCTLLNGSLTETDGTENISFVKENIGREVFQKTMFHSYEPDFWLLVQYSTAKTNFIYEIIKASDVTWKEKNVFNTVIAYLRRNESVIQAKILKASKRFEETLYALDLIHKGIFNSPSLANNTYDETFKRFNDIDYEFLSTIEEGDMKYYYHHDGGMLDYINEVPKNTVGYRIKTLTGMLYTDPIYKRIIEGSSLFSRLAKMKDEIMAKQSRLDAKKEQIYKAKKIMEKKIKNMQELIEIL